MPVVSTQIDVSAELFQKTREETRGLLTQIEGLLAEAAAGGGEKATERLLSRGKLPIRERAALLLDPDTPFLEIGALAGNQTDYKVGGGLLLGIGSVSGTECVILGNDPTVMGGAMTAISVKKISRGLELARENRLPYIQFVESAGGDLRAGGAGGGGIEAALRRNLFHFGESGRMFYEITELSKMGIPTISVVFGSSTAGGAYQPGMSDYNIFVRNQAKVFLGGPPLVKMATGEESDDETLGGAEMHASVSGLGDYLAEDEPEAIRMCRDVVAHLRWRKLGPGPTCQPDPPVLDPEELLGLIPHDLKTPVDVREVIARVVDGSRFEEFKVRYGATIVCGWASIHGFPVGILGNNGVLFPNPRRRLRSSSSSATRSMSPCCSCTTSPATWSAGTTSTVESSSTGAR